MVGNGGRRFNSQTDATTNNKPYHGQRRNAVFSLRHYKSRPNVSNEDESNEGSEVGAYKNSPADHSGFRQRNRVTFKHTVQSRYKLTNNRGINNILKDEDDDTIMKNEGPSSAFTSRDANRGNLSKRIVRNFQGKTQDIARVTFKSKQLKIGDSSHNVTKPFLPSQPFCKLNIMDQGTFDYCVKFLQQYFTCFDKSREELLAAYHKKAIFSLNLNVRSEASPSAQPKFGDYFRESRNLKHVSGYDRLFKMLHVGNIDIVALINKFPPTEHDSNSLKLDTSFMMDKMLKLSVVGVFKEGKPEDKVRPMRSFQRVLICVPTENQGIIIVNEQLTISNLSFEQSKLFREDTTKSQMEVIPVTTTVVTTNVPATIVASNSVPNLIQQQTQLIERFSAETRLNLNWSKDCLEFASWDYNQALRKFQEHKNDIPADAFLSSPFF